MKNLVKMFTIKGNIFIASNLKFPFNKSYFVVCYGNASLEQLLIYEKIVYIEEADEFLQFLNVGCYCLRKLF